MNSVTAHTYALILAGGGGTRLWPQSRNKTPKQFLKLAGNLTMLQKTAERFAQIVPWDHIFVIANQAHQTEVMAQLPKLPAHNLVFEPAKKDTALAMLVGALYIGAFDPQAIILNEASDHVVVDEAKYCQILKSAATVASDTRYLVAVGIKPESPSTAFGYIKVGAKLPQFDQTATVFQVESFTEKPNEETARQFIATGKYYWNANNYVWSLQALLTAFDKLLPEMSQLTAPLRTAPPEQFHDLFGDIYNRAQPISIDYAISEKADNLLLIPADYGWNDIGEWQVVYDLSQKDESGNVISTDAPQPDVPPVLMEAHNNMIHTDKRMIALLGVGVRGVLQRVLLPRHRTVRLVANSGDRPLRRVCRRIGTP